MPFVKCLRHCNFLSFSGSRLRWDEVTRGSNRQFPFPGDGRRLATNQMLDASVGRGTWRRNGWAAEVTAPWDSSRGRHVVARWRFLSIRHPPTPIKLHCSSFCFCTYERRLHLRTPKKRKNIAFFFLPFSNYGYSVSWSMSTMPMQCDFEFSNAFVDCVVLS